MPNMFRPELFDKVSDLCSSIWLPENKLSISKPKIVSNITDTIKTPIHTNESCFKEEGLDKTRNTNGKINKNTAPA